MHTTHFGTRTLRHAPSHSHAHTHTHTHTHTHMQTYTHTYSYTDTLAQLTVCDTNRTHWYTTDCSPTYMYDDI